MKNKLIIITSTIGRMGGAQMYVENKVIYFQSKGWDVFVFYYNYAEKILLPGLEQFRDYYLPDLRHPLQCVPDYRIRKVVSRIKEIVCPEDSFVVIESQLVISAYWAELMAKQFQAHHIINMLEEQAPPFTEKENEFFEFKLLRGEIMNATLPRLHTIFKNRFKEEYKNHTRTVTIPCANVVSSDVDDSYNFKDSDYTILSIGRLDKPYIPTMNEEVKKFASMVSDKTINIVYVGGSYDGSMEVSIPQFFEGVKNVNCYVLGYVFPIPQSLIKRADVAIACANSVLVAANEGVPTIVVDVDDYSAIGVFGYTTMNKFKRTTETYESVSSLLDQILLKNILKDIAPSISDTIDQDKVFEEDMKYFLANDGRVYYDVNSIYSSHTKLFSKAKFLIKSLFKK